MKIEGGKRGQDFGEAWPAVILVELGSVQLTKPPERGTNSAMIAAGDGYAQTTRG